MQEQQADTESPAVVAKDEGVGHGDDSDTSNNGASTVASSTHVVADEEVTATEASGTSPLMIKANGASATETFKPASAIMSSQEFLDLEQDDSRLFTRKKSSTIKLEDIPCHCLCFFGYETCCTIVSCLGCATFLALIVILGMYLHGSFV